MVSAPQGAGSNDAMRKTLLFYNCLFSCADDDDHDDESAMAWRGGCSAFSQTNQSMRQAVCLLLR